MPVARWVKEFRPELARDIAPGYAEIDCRTDYHKARIDDVSRQTHTQSLSAARANAVWQRPTMSRGGGPFWFRLRAHSQA